MWTYTRGNNEIQKIKNNTDKKKKIVMLLLAELFRCHFRLPLRNLFDISTYLLNGVVDRCAVKTNVYGKVNTMTFTRI